MKLFLCFLLLPFGVTSFADYFEIHYEVKENDSFGIILSRFLKSDSIVRKTTPMVIKTRKNNPQVKNWEELEVGSVLKIFLEKEMVDEKKLEGERLKRWKTFFTINKKFQYTLFYMMSSGRFKQVFTDAIEFHYTQRSLFTFGGLIKYNPSNSKYSFSSSLYFSSFGKSIEKTLSKEYNPPLEIGLNFYGQYKLKWNNLWAYGGLDFDHFGTLNHSVLTGSNNLENILNNIFYLTVGVQKNFEIKSQKFIIRSSFAQSIFSLKNSLPKSYSGFRYLFYLTYKLNKKIGINGLFKYHSVSGDNDLTVTRYGLGCSYSF